MKQERMTIEEMELKYPNQWLSSTVKSARIPSSCQV